MRHFGIETDSESDEESERDRAQSEGAERE
jgi:hypothetical protein